MQIISQYFNQYKIHAIQEDLEEFDLKEFESDVLLSLPLDTMTQPEVLEKIIKERLDERMKEIAQRKLNQKE